MDFFYGSADSLGMLFPDEFGNLLPHKALTLAGAAVWSLLNGKRSADGSTASLCFRSREGHDPLYFFFPANVQIPV